MIIIAKIRKHVDKIASEYQRFRRCTHLHGPVYASHRRPVVFLTIRMQIAQNPIVAPSRVHVSAITNRYWGWRFDITANYSTIVCYMVTNLRARPPFCELESLLLTLPPLRETVVPTCNARAISSSDPPSRQRIPSSQRKDDEVYWTRRRWISWVGRGESNGARVIRSSVFACVYEPEKQSLKRKKYFSRETFAV